MNSIGVWAGAIGLIAGALIYPQETAAEGFTGEVFATWSRSSQDSYIQTSVMMAGVVLTRIKPSASNCIDAWYFKEPKEERNRYISETIVTYTDYHPSGVILAIIEQECGALKE